jgi:ABC-2 type transport system permease protein
MSKPVSRTHILTSKLLAAFASLTITNLAIWVSAFFAISLFSEGRPVDNSTLVLLLLTIFVFQLFFLSVGLVISLLLKRIRSVTSYGLGLAFGTYVLNGFSGILGDIKLEYITPFKHIESAYIIAHKAYNVPLLLLNIAISLIAIAASYWLYTRRDIKAVS